MHSLIHAGSDSSDRYACETGNLAQARFLEKQVWFRTSVIKRRYEISEYIGGFKQTRRTETSQYPEERTSTETPLVVASESGPGQ